jgi:hypothetical protein
MAFKMESTIERCKDCHNFRWSRNESVYDEHCAEFKFSFGEFNYLTGIDPRCEHNKKEEKEFPEEFQVCLHCNRHEPCNEFGKPHYCNKEKRSFNT